MKISELKTMIKQQVVTLMIGCKREEYPALLKMMEDIRVKDSTFQFLSKSSLFKNNDYVFMVKCSDIHNAHKRGIWVISKFKQNTGKELFYKVKGDEIK